MKNSVKQRQVSPIMNNSLKHGIISLIGKNTRILRRILGPKGDENGDWTRLHNGELHSLYSSPNIVRAIKSRRLRWAGHVARTEEVRSAPKNLTGTSAEERPLGRPRPRWEDTIRMDLKEMGIITRNWVD